MNCSQYVEYLAETAEAIRKEKDYITELDAAVADGDHWLNIMIGFDKVLEKKDQLKQCGNFQEFFKSLAMAVMNGMGGTSGALYGSAYLASAKMLGNIKLLDEKGIGEMLDCWSEAFMVRGNTKPGEKTMVDALYPAVRAYEDSLKDGAGIKEALLAMKEGAKAGAEATRDMKAAKGRASNQPDKGVGHLDPGAVTMKIQLECLADYLTEHCMES